jgi:hypothetical protein
MGMEGRRRQRGKREEKLTKNAGNPAEDREEDVD